MKIIKILIVAWMFSVIAFAWYATDYAATYNPLTDTIEVLPHSEISEAEIYGEMMMEQSIERNNHRE
jgi:hypothetical protein